MTATPLGDGLFQLVRRLGRRDDYSMQGRVQVSGTSWLDVAWTVILCSQSRGSKWSFTPSSARSTSWAPWATSTHSPLRSVLRSSAREAQHGEDELERCW